MDQLTITNAISLGSAFTGALVGCLSLGFWLATRFNNVYKALARHELDDERRFGELKLSIADARIQATAAVIKPGHK